MASFGNLRDEQFISLTTFRRNGTPVSTAVWFALLDGKILITTATKTGKVKRIRNRGDVTIAPSTRMGKPTGPEQPGQARLLQAEESVAAYQALKRKYGLQYTLIMFVHRLQRLERILIEVEPA